MDPFLQVNDVLPGADGAKKSSMPKSEPKLSITELVSKARKQSKIEEQDNEDDERERRESNRQHDILHDMTAHEGHAHAVFCVAFHPEGRLLLSASGDKTVKLWDLQTHRVLTTFTEHEQWVYSVAFFHNMMAFATGCDDGRVRIYENKSEDPVNHETGWNLECDLGQGGKHDPANGHRAGVQSVDVSRDDAYVVSASATFGLIAFVSRWFQSCLAHHVYSAKPTQKRIMPNHMRGSCVWSIRSAPRLTPR